MNNTPSPNDDPVPQGTLDDATNFGDQNAVSIKAFVGYNLGSRTLLTHIPMYDFFRMSDVANERGENGEAVAQRPLDMKHAEDLAKYMIKGLLTAAIAEKENMKQNVPNAYLEIQEKMGKQPYLSLQPIVANLRSCQPGGKQHPSDRMITKNDELAGFKIWMSQRDILWVVDGQHRRKAMDLVFEFLSSIRSTHKYPKKLPLYSEAHINTISIYDLDVWEACNKAARGFCTIAVEIHLGLDIKQERQMFYDLNNLGKKVEKSLALVFDGSNPVNSFIKDFVEDKIVRLSETDKKDWKDDDGSLTYKDVASISAHLFLNKTNISGATPTQVKERSETAKIFWDKIKASPGFGSPMAKDKTVLAQPVVLKAIAKLTYDFAWGKKKDEDNLNKLFNGIQDIDFSHNNPMWRFYELSLQEKTEFNLLDLEAYLPSNSEGKRDLGMFQGNRMRFGAKHNDIFPLIGDMIRWKLNLPKRSE